MSGKHIINKEDFPTTPHFAIVEFGSIRVEGDERSRTNPGHGYPAHDVSTAGYIAFGEREEWLIAIKERAEQDTKYRSGQNWVAFEVGKVARVETKVVVGVD